MTEIEELRAEIAKLREEIAGLRLNQNVTHYHYHGPQLPLYWPSQPQWPNPYGQPYTTCGRHDALQGSGGLSLAYQGIAHSQAAQ